MLKTAARWGLGVTLGLALLLAACETPAPTAAPAPVEPSRVVSTPTRTPLASAPTVVTAPDVNALASEVSAKSLTAAAATLTAQPSATKFAPHLPDDIAVLDTLDKQLVEDSPNHLVYTTGGFFEKFQPYFDDSMTYLGWSKVPGGATQAGQTLQLTYSKDNRTAVITIEPDAAPERWRVTVDLTEN